MSPDRMPVRVDEVVSPPDYELKRPPLEGEAKARMEAELYRLELRDKIVWPADELMAATFPPMRFAIPGLIPTGETVFGGKPKIGKSFWVLSCAVAVASGGVFMSQRVEAGDVLYLALEDSARRVQTRLSKILQGAQAPSRLTVATAWEFLDEGGEERLDEWLTTHSDARLVVIDTGQRIRRPGAGRDRYAEDYQAWASLQTLAMRHEVAIVVVHHLRKDTDPADWIDSVSGSTGITGAVDTIAALFRERGSMDATLRITGRDLEGDIDLALKSTDGIWSLLGPADEHRLSMERAAILEAVKDLGGEAQIKEIAALLGKSVAATSKLAIALADDGLLQPVSRGVYKKPVETGETVESNQAISTESTISTGIDALFVEEFGAEVPS